MARKKMARKTKKVKEKQVIHEHHHYAPEWKGLIKIILIFIAVFVVLVNLLGWVTSAINEDKEIYRNCVDGCSKKHFIGQDIGLDNTIKSKTVQEFDRTDCIISCNEMLIMLKGEGYCELNIEFIEVEE